MTHPTFRFLHASDFRLDQPLGGIAEVPNHLRELFIEAPYSAAEKVFEAAVLEGAKFLILAGDILRPLFAGSRALLFLGEQFEKLAARGIDVYWCGGDLDSPDDWPASLHLPGNVHVFPRGRVDEYIVSLEGIPAARIMGTSRERRQPLRTGEFRPDSTGLFNVAVACGEADASMHDRGIHYWALGGGPERETASREILVPGQSSRLEADSPPTIPSIVHHCGTPQGRRPDESGLHGCTLVQVDERNQARAGLIPCDAARWLAERIVIEPAATRQGLEMRLRERLQSLREASPKMNLLVSWTVAGEGELAQELHRGRLAAEMLEGLRAEFGFNSPAAWSVGFETEPVEAFPQQWYERDTIRGDFLRALEQLRMNPAEPLDIDAYLPESILTGNPYSIDLVPNEAARRRILDEAALLGVELLGGEEKFIE
jgi:DNA repair protein SbcD/Mre11